MQVVLAVLIGCCAFATTAAASNSYFKNSAIADVAERSGEGSPGGQCIRFVGNVLRAVSGNRVNISAYAFGYQGTFRAKGGTLISSPNAAVRGDIIQVTPAGTPDSWIGPEHAPLHTAIIRKNLKNGNFAVIDSNSKYDERVHRHEFNPYAMVRKYGGGIVKIWRLGAVPKSPPKKPKAAPPGKGDSTGYYDPGPAGWHLSNALAPGSSNYIFARGKPGVIPVVGDWNGDGKDSTGVYFPWDRSWHLRNELNSGPSEYAFVRGQPNSIPVVGDWDGDGKDSTGVYFPWDQSWHLRNELNPGSSEYAFVRGQPNAIPVVGDWNGDGKDSTGVYYPWDGTWHLRNELNPGPSEYAFHRGRPGIIPVVGDWNGDGKDSTGVYFPWDRSWHLRNRLNDGPSDYAFNRGKSGTIPVVGNWDGR